MAGAVLTAALGHLTQSHQASHTYKRSLLVGHPVAGRMNVSQHLLELCASTNDLTGSNQEVTSTRTRLALARLSCATTRAVCN